MALALRSPAILVLTHSGRTALAISKFRPKVPIAAFTDDEHVRRELELSYGIKPLRIAFDNDPEQTVSQAFEQGKQKKLFSSGERVIVISDAKTKDGLASTVQIRYVP
jgi:pyruvate kinase